MTTHLEIIGTSLLWAGLATALVLLYGIPLAYLLARFRFPGHSFLSTLVSLPMVLPPTATGFLLLQALADDGILGKETLGFDPSILFTWKAVVLACACMATPLVVRTARVSFETVDPKLEEMAFTLGYSRFKAFFAITLPLAWKGLVAATILGFTRSLGEFGATIMIAGNIPGKTQTLASAIYSAQQSGNDARATLLVLLALAVGFIAILFTEVLGRPTNGRDKSQ